MRFYVEILEITPDGDFIVKSVGCRTFIEARVVYDGYKNRLDVGKFYVRIVEGEEY